MDLSSFEHLRLELRRGCLVLALLAELRCERHGYALVLAYMLAGLDQRAMLGIAELVPVRGFEPRFHG